MPSCNFTIPGKPKGKGRPRFARMGKFVKTYSPKETIDYEGLVKMAAYQAMRGRPPTSSACCLEMDCYSAIPKSWSKKNREKAIAGQIGWTGKPDFDNLAKCVGDGANEVIWKDDSQIVRAVVTKQYSTTPRVEVRIYWED